jgi:hypothetical protein
MREQFIPNASTFKSLMLETLWISVKLAARLELLNQKYPSDELRQAIDRLRQSTSNAVLNPVTGDMLVIDKTQSGFPLEPLRRDAFTSE